MAALPWLDPPKNEGGDRMADTEPSIYPAKRPRAGAWRIAESQGMPEAHPERDPRRAGLRVVSPCPRYLGKRRCHAKNALNTIT